MVGSYRKFRAIRITSRHFPYPCIYIIVLIIIKDLLSSLFLYCVFYDIKKTATKFVIGIATAGRKTEFKKSPFLFADHIPFARAEFEQGNCSCIKCCIEIIF